MTKTQSEEPQPTQLTQFAIDQAERLAARARMQELDSEEREARERTIARGHATSSPLNPNSPFNRDGTRKVVKGNTPIVVAPKTAIQLAAEVKPKLAPRTYDPLTASLPPSQRALYGNPNVVPVEVKKSITLKPTPAKQGSWPERIDDPLAQKVAELNTKPTPSIPSYLLKECPVCGEQIEASRSFHTRANGGTCVVDAEAARRDGVVAVL